MSTTNEIGRELRKSLLDMETAKQEAVEAKTRSRSAETTASEAKTVAEHTQTQLDEIAKASTIDPAVTQMTVGRDGTIYPSPDARLRAENQVLSELLAQTASKTFELKDWELQNRTRKAKPMISIIDDDGRSAVLTKLKPLSEKYNIPFTVASYVRANEVPYNNYMTKDDLIMLENMGWEISSHTYNHPNLSTLSDEQQEYELKHSKDVLENWGLKVTTICYPFDGRNDKTYELARKYYRGARRSYGGVNTIPLETFELRCNSLGSWFDTHSSYDTKSLEYYKSRVDSAINNNGWTIFLTHCADPNHDAAQQSHLEEMIKYAQSLGVEFVTFNEGLNRMGNIVDTGHYSRVDTNKKHFVIGADGTLSATDVQDMSKKTRLNEFSHTSKPSDFPFGYIHYSRIPTANADGFPENTAGLLITDASVALNALRSHVYQYYHVLGSTGLYKRVGNESDGWSVWRAIHTLDIRLGLNEVSATTPISSFESNRISYCQITSANATGFPKNTAGLLITNRIVGNTQGYNYQDYHIFESNEVYTRATDRNGNWLNWELVNSQIVSMALNAATPTMLPVDYPALKISYCRISTVGASGFPMNTAGKLTTNRITTSVAGHAWQEYDLFNSWRKFKRYEKTDGTWSDWKEFSMV